MATTIPTTVPYHPPLFNMTAASFSESYPSTSTGMGYFESDLSIFENKTGLADDMKFLASMPELCDVTFLVGETREPVCAVKAVLAARSRVFQKLLYQAPSPQRRKEPPQRENKLRLFLKRSSEPLLNLQNAAQQRSGFTQQLAPIPEPTGHQHQTLIIEEFEPDVFRQLIEYIHTGGVTLQPRTLLGVMNAADYYGLEELRRASAGFVQYCINVDTVCALLASAERYIQYKCTKNLVQKVLEFVDEHGNEVLNLGSFTLLPQHVVRLILAREELRADEFTKFQAALMWSKKYCDSSSNNPLKEVLGNFLEYIQFHKIPANVLMREIHPLGIVPYSIIMNALAFQADPASVDPGKLSPNSSRVRRARASKGRSMSVQSSLDPYGSNTTLSSTGSSDPPNGSKRSPSGVSPHDSKSPSSTSQKSPMSLSRQNTVRQSHRRKNSASLNLQGRRSPCGAAPEQRSPQGRRSPVFLSYESSRSGHRSPTDRRSPTSSIHVQQQSGHRSPIDYERRSPLSGVAPSLDKQMTGGISPDERRSSLQQSIILGRRSPIGFSQGMMIPLGSNRSSTVYIPPITISNPSETIAIIQRQVESNVESSADEKSPPPVERKEKTSVMREILAFVRKPSKKATTRTSRFAAAFSRAESTSGSPLLRQSTFSSAPTASSRAAKSAVTKQMSESLEPKMSLRFRTLASTTKLSLRLRRSDTSKGKDAKKSSGDEVSDVESMTDVRAVEKLGAKPSGSSANGGLSFELENVHFEKVGDSYIKHEQIREETIEEASPVKTERRPADGTLDAQGPIPCGKSPLEEETERIEELKRSLLSLLPPVEGSVDDPSQEATDAIEKAAAEFTLEKPQVPATSKIQCPTFEIEPPSRRASFDPPRSPYLENLRSPSGRGDDPNGFRRDSGADSFEIVDTDRNRESSFEDRYSSIDTSFDISRYHSTSYEDQTSSFEMMEAGDKRSPFDLRKSSIELVDVETFQHRSGGSSDGRKSSLETHFDYTQPHGMAKHFHSRKHQHRAGLPRPRSPLSQQTSSNYSSRDSYDSGSEPLVQKRFSGSRSPFADPTRQHFPLPPRSPCTGTDGEPFLCMDQRCASIFEPRPVRNASPYLTCSSGSEFEPPSPRRASSVSPKHTFTFRIVLKKVESSPDDLCPTREPRRPRVDRHKRRDSRRKR